MSASGRTLRALMRANRCVALNGMLSTCFRRRRRVGRCRCRFGLLGLAAVPLECPRGSKLAEALADHVFRHEHLDMRLAVVNHEGQADELWHDRAGSSPRLDRLLGAGLLCRLDLLEHLEVHEWTFFAGSTHRGSIYVSLICP